MDRIEPILQEFARLSIATNVRTPNETIHCQSVIEEFMVLVEANETKGRRGEKAMDEFCKFIGHAHIWHLAEMVVPQIRHSRSEK